MKNNLRTALRQSFLRLLQEDGSLFDCLIEDEEYSPNNARKLHEVCINHKLANHLEKDVLPNLTPMGKMFVDIEFNREGLNPKTTNYNGEDRTLRPDIIIHNRRTGEDKINFLVVECKKKGSAPTEINKDRQKICALMQDERYKYMFGLQVMYGEGEVKGVLFFTGISGIQSENIGSFLNKVHHFL
jgi:hypothetical protein